MTIINGSDLTNVPKEDIILGNSFVSYISHHGDDQYIVQRARTSYLGTSKGDAADKKLMFRLLSSKHTSPFEMGTITFAIRLPIAIMRQLVRHRTFRLNKVSARFRKLDLGHYFPSEWRAQDTKNKQGSLFDDGNTIDQHKADLIYSNAVQATTEAYNKLLEMGIAREMSRLPIVVGALTEINIQCDLNNLLKFFSLRDDNHAQWEHQEIARKMKEHTRRYFPWVMTWYDEMRAELANKRERDRLFLEEIKGHVNSNNKEDAIQMLNDWISELSK